MAKMSKENREDISSELVKAITIAMYNNDEFAQKLSELKIRFFEDVFKALFETLDIENMERMLVEIVSL